MWCVRQPVVSFSKPSQGPQATDCFEWSMFFMGKCSSGGTPGLYTRTFAICNLHHDLTAHLECNVKLFADDKSLFTVVQDPNAASENINHDFALVSQWAHHWKISFKPDQQKQAVELRFSKKRIAVDHPVMLFSNIPVKQVDQHKHLGLILDSKLSFSAHIISTISKARKGISLLNYLSKYLPRHTFNDLYKLSVRPQLDYGDAIYPIPTKVCNYSQNIICQV